MIASSDESAFTGLEAAIVLIAFVVVASVFSYVVLGAGFYTTQKSQEVVHTGIQQATSTMDISGMVYGTGTAGGSIDTINFSADLAPGGTPIDFERVVITYSNATVLETLTRVTKGTTPNAGQWSVAAVRNEVSNDNVMERGEQFDIMLKPSNTIPKNDQFHIEVKPAVGASLSITKSAPSSVQAVNILY